MKQLISLSFLLCLSAVCQAVNLKMGKPTDEELKMTVYDKDPSAPAVMLCNLTEVGYTMDYMNYAVDYNVKVRIKVLKEEGKKFADLSIPYIDNIDEKILHESIEEFKATVFNMENGKVVKKRIGRESVFTERVNENYLLAKVAIPQVRVGSVIEYEYKRHSSIYFHIYDWVAQEDIPVVYAKYQLEIPATLQFNVETNNLLALQTQVTAGSLNYIDNLPRPKTCKTNVYTCVGTDLPAIKKDDYVWNASDYYTKVTAELKSLNLAAGISRDIRRTWDQIDDILLTSSSFGGRLNDHSKFREELAASGISGLAGVKDKVAAVFQLLRKKVAWNGEYKLEPRPASEVIKKGSGTNADLNMMLINMLGDVGIQAAPVVMSTRKHGKLPKTYPSLDKLNTFIVGIPNNGSWLYVDASSVDGYINVLPANLYTSQARIIQKGTKGQWVDLQKIGDASTLVTVTGSITADGQMTGTQNITYFGNDAANERRAFREAPDSTAFVSQKATRDGISISKCVMTGHRDFCPSLQEVIDFSRQGDVTDDHIYIHPFINLPVTDNPFLETERVLPVEFPHKQLYSMTVRLTIPDGWQVEEMPKGTKLSAVDKSISGHVLCEAGNDHTIAIKYQFRLNDMTYSPAQYGILKQLFELFSERSKDVIVLKKSR